jgi:hypothetical protein
VQVAPEVDVIREQVCYDAKLLHFDKLVLRHKLIVLQPVPGRQLRILQLGNAELRWRSGKRAALPTDCRRTNVSQSSQHSVVRILQGAKIHQGAKSAAVPRSRFLL